MTGQSTFLSGQLNQKAVYWANPVNDGYGGRSFDDAIEIDVRWEDRQELFIDASGEEVRSRSVVYVAIDMSSGEYLYLGILAGLSSTEEGDPLTVSSAYAIRAFRKIPNVAGDVFVRKAWL